MKLIYKLTLVALLALPSIAIAATTFPVNGGTGSTTLSGILIGNGTSPVNSLTVGTGLTLTGTVLAATGGSSFGYPFPNNATTTNLTFTNGITALSVTGVSGSNLTIQSAASRNLFLNNSSGFGIEVLNSGFINFSSAFSQGLRIVDPVSGQSVILDTAAIASSDKTFTFPNASGTLCLTTTCTGTTYTGTFPINVSGSTISFGGLSTTTNLTQGFLPYVTGVNTFGQVATTTVSCAGTASCTPFVAIGASPITITGTGGSGTVTSVTGTYPILSSGGTTPNISTAFGTTTSNTFAGTQTFTNSPIFSTLSAGTVNSNATGGIYSTATSSVSSGTGISFTGTPGALIGGSNLTVTNSGVISNTCSAGITCSGTNPSSFSIGANALTLSQFPQIAANTVIGNRTGVTATPTAFATSSLGIALADTTGTLPISRGGTNATSLGTNEILYYDGTSITNNANLTYDGTSVGAFNIVSQNVSIPNNNANALQIVGNSSNSVGFLIANSSAGAHSWSFFSSGGGPSPAGSFGFYDNTGGGMRMIVDATGNVGINDANPATKLSVVGNAAIGYASNQSAPTNGLVVQGNVGIGTTTPNHLLTVSGSDSNTSLTTTNIPEINIINQNTTVNNASDLAFNTADTNGVVVTGTKLASVFTSHTPGAVSSDLAFVNRTAGTLSEKMRLTSAGAVGIGLTNPGSTLEVMGTTTTANASAFTAWNSSAASIFNIRNDGLITHGSFIANASSTVGNGTQAGGLVTNGGATTTKNAYFASDVGIGTQNFLNQLDIGPVTPQLAVVNTATAAVSVEAASKLTMTLGNTLAQSATGGAALGFFSDDGTTMLKDNRMGNFFFGGATVVGSLFSSVKISAFADQNWSSTAAGGYLTFTTTPDGTIVNQERMRIAANGNVGVATTSPWRTLAVTGTVGFDGLTAAVGTVQGLCLVTATKEVVANSLASCVTSSRRWKTDINYSDIGGLDTLMQFQPATFTRTDSQLKQMGFIAEDVAAIDPRLAGFDDQGLPSSIDDTGILAITVKAVQQLAATQKVVARSAEENWQDILIAFLILGFIYQQYQIRKLTK